LEDSLHDHSKAALTPRHLLSILRLASAHARLRESKELEVRCF
jgi:DNA replicative helicase MCM subunit Mcm2 (Cdc46/Mcm family)